MTLGMNIPPSLFQSFRICSGSMPWNNGNKILCVSSFHGDDEIKDSSRFLIPPFSTCQGPLGSSYRDDNDGIKFFTFLLPFS